MCFIDEHSNSTTSADLSLQHHVKHTYIPQNSDSAIIKIATIADASVQAAPSVVLVHKDGSLECIDSVLGTAQWTLATPGLSSKTTTSQSEISYVALTDLGSARHGLLRGRPDALADLERILGDDAAANHHSLLITIAASTAGNLPLTRLLRCFALPIPVSSGPPSALRQPQQVVEYPLPGPARDHGPVQYDLHASTGTLFQLLPGSLTTWNLSGTLPKQLSTVPNTLRDFSDFTVLTPSLVATCTGTACKLIDATHCSQQAVQSAVNAETRGGQRRASTDASSMPALHTVGYFADLGLLIARQSNRLLAFQVSIRSINRGQTVSHASLLADAYCKGLPEIPKSRTLQESGRPDTSKDVEWNEWRKTVDQLADAGDVDQLERFLAREMNIARQKIRPSVSADQSISLDPLEADPVSIAWQFPKSNSKLVGQTRKRKALHCLRKIFVIDQASADGHGLSIALYAQEILAWLAMTGFLSTSALQEAFVEEDEQRSTRIAKGALAQAFVELDPTLGVVHDFLDQPVHIDAEEVVCALQAVIRSLESPLPAEVAQKLLMGGPEVGTTKEDVADDTLLEESQAAEADLAFALASLNDGLAMRSEVLGVIFSRLISYPSASVVRLLRKQLSDKELIFLITLLRIELADGGWTVRYQDSPDDSDAAEGFSNRSISIIAKLLNMAVDAVGTSGWLVGFGGDSGMTTDEMLLVLRAETTAALEGCYEAEILKAQLNDFERYTRSLEQTHGKKGKKRKYGHQDDDESALLPMGCKVDTVETTTVSKGGKVREKSANAIRKEMSMKVGRYTVDRIRV